MIFLNTILVRFWIMYTILCMTVSFLTRIDCPLAWSTFSDLPDVIQRKGKTVFSKSLINIFTIVFKLPKSSKSFVSYHCDNRMWIKPNTFTNTFFNNFVFLRTLVILSTLALGFKVHPSLQADIVYMIIYHKACSLIYSQLQGFTQYATT